jgi:mutator protein MutT
MTDLGEVEVALALVWRRGRLLITRRPSGVHLAGFWEFPGGKLRAGETPEDAAVREVVEEVGLRCRARARRPAVVHDYPDRRVTLHPVDCDWEHGEAEQLEVDAIAWVEPRELPSYPFPEANGPLLEELSRQAPSG